MMNKPQRVLPESSPKVVVVGAGIVGICAALQLQRAGLETVILDRRPPGEGASFGNASIVGEQAVAPVAMPGILKKLPSMLLDNASPLAVRWPYLRHLAPWLVRFVASARPSRVRHISKALAALLDGSMAAYEPLLEAAGGSHLIRKTGWLCLYETEKGFRGDSARLDLEQCHNRRMEIYPGEALQQVEPALKNGAKFYTGVYYPDVGYAIDNLELVKVLAHHFRQGGGRIFRESVSSFERGETGVTSVRTNRATHLCNHLVIAAGAWSQPLARQLGSNPPLDTERGYSLTLPEAGVAPRMPIYSTERGMACTPLSRGLRVAGTVELGGLESPPDWRRADLLFQNVKRWFPDLKGEAAGHWMGFRPSFPDSLPVISRAPGVPNTVFAFGHGHCGLMLGARTGELVRDLILDREPVVDPAPYRVDRF